MAATLYLRNVPDEVIERLHTLAAQTGASISATAIAELASATMRAANADVLAALPDVRVSAEQIIVDLEGSRSER